MEIIVTLMEILTAAYWWLHIIIVKWKDSCLVIKLCVVNSSFPHLKMKFVTGFKRDWEKFSGTQILVFNGANLHNVFGIISFITLLIIISLIYGFSIGLRVVLFFSSQLLRNKSFRDKKNNYFGYKYINNYIQILPKRIQNNY